MSSDTSFGSLILQDRDRALLRGLLECRVMTARHIAILYFDSKAEYTKTRLRQLKRAGLIAERPRHVTEPAVLSLTGKALTLLRKKGVLNEYPAFSASTLEKRAQVSDLTIHHELEIMDVKAAFHLAISQSGKFSVGTFCTWPLLYQFEAFRSGQSRKEVLIKPDGFIRIDEHLPNDGLIEHSFFLEVDRSTEMLDTLVARANGYRDFLASGGFAVRNGGTRADVKDYPFRVLMVFKTAERRNNMAERLLTNNPPIFNLVCLSTQAEVTNNPLGPIWIRPSEYREVTTRTKFDTGLLQPKWGYKKQTARDGFLDKNVKKLSLFV